jgi:phospholipid/cholesterol/gamma-HCH transport system permease protein
MVERAKRLARMSAEPTFSREESGDGLLLRLSGRWTVETPGVEDQAGALVDAGKSARHVVLDVAGLEAMDTAGAWLIDRTRVRIADGGAQASLAGASQEYELLFKEAHYRQFAVEPPPRVNIVIDLLSQIGRDVAGGFADLLHGISFLGQITVALGKSILRPRHLRVTSIIHHMENYGFQGVPIIALINFIVGCIVAQQGIYQLRRFGAATYSIDLLGILVLRELAVLLTSIMVAGRTGSAITAELGSMKMREEIDALRVMGLEPVEVLVVPRVLGLLLSLPLLTVIADLAGLFGGLVVFWAYEGINPAAYSELLKEAIGLNTFLVGLIKAPFMALVIALTGAIEGFAVLGSAESLGRQTTASVVKSIFMIIVIDGIFAIYFAAIKY